MNRKLIILSISILPFYSAFGNVGTKLKDWFDNQNFSNRTSPGIYEGQSARYLTAGGVTLRNPVTSAFKFVDVQTPKFSAGCGGIDLYMGGISGVNADAFIKSLRNIGQNATSLAFMLAIQVVSPQLSGVIEDIKTWADKINSFNMNSCQAATTLVGGAMDYMGAKEGNCIVTRMESFQEDYTTAKHACTTGGKLKETQNSGDPNKVDFTKGNLAWYVLMRDPYFSSDLDFAELIMNLTGTIVIYDTDNSPDSSSNIRIIDPLMGNNYASENFANIYKSLLEGKELKIPLKIIQCINKNADKKACTQLTPGRVTITATWEGLYGKIKNLIDSIRDKIYSDQKLTEQEKGLISSTSIPLYRYLTVTSAYFPKSSNFSKHTNDIAAIIAEDILLTSLNSIISQVKQLASLSSSGPTPPRQMKQYQDNLLGLLDGISKMKKENTFSSNKFFEMQKNIQLYEKALMGRLGSGLVTNAIWGNQ